MCFSEQPAIDWQFPQPLPQNLLLPEAAINQKLPPLIPSLCSINLLFARMSPRTYETYLLTKFSIHYKSIIQEQPITWKRCTGQSVGKGAELSGSFPFSHSAPSPHVHQPRGFLNPILLGFYGVVTDRWPLIQPSAPLLGGIESSNPFIQVGSPGNQSPSLGYLVLSQSHCISIT